MALTITVAEVTGFPTARVGNKYERIVTLSITGDNSAVSGTMPNVRALGFQEVEAIFQMEPLTEATPDEDEFYPLKFIKAAATGVWTVYVGDNHSGAALQAADGVHTAKIKLIGY